MLNRDLKNVICIAEDPKWYARQPENGVRIT
jgi:TFIIF-interacting CTD phosphatase-like protein